MIPVKLAAATNNAHKLTEIKAILAGFQILSPRELGIEGFDPEENGATYEANALIKARALRALTHLPVFADDSGLSVNALAGAPGVLSARYAGYHAPDEINNALLLENLAHTADRTAKFVCCIAYIDEKGEEHIFRGETDGVILTAPRGGTGFGYDPLFLSADLEKTFAEASPEEKNRVSHRARALKKLFDFLARE